MACIRTAPLPFSVNLTVTGTMAAGETCVGDWSVVVGAWGLCMAEDVGTMAWTGMVGRRWKSSGVGGMGLMGARGRT